jgi:hypothetical protein
LNIQQRLFRANLELEDQRSSFADLEETVQRLSSVAQREADGYALLSEAPHCYVVHFGYAQYATALRQSNILDRPAQIEAYHQSINVREIRLESELRTVRELERLNYLAYGDQFASGDEFQIMLDDYIEMLRVRAEMESDLNRLRRRRELGDNLVDDRAFNGVAGLTDQSLNLILADYELASSLLLAHLADNPEAARSQVVRMADQRIQECMSSEIQ